MECSCKYACFEERGRSVFLGLIVFSDFSIVVGFPTSVLKTCGTLTFA